MDKIYLDNASTTFPKPKEVADAMYEYMTKSGVNINRGNYEAACSVEEIVFETRELLSELFNAADCKNVVFTKNVTESLNVILKGFLKPGDHVLVSGMEHNSVMRPINQLAEKGIAFSRIPCDKEGRLIISEIDVLIRDNTKAIVMTHASNVCGSIMPLEYIGELCRKRAISFIVDSAQTAGVLPIDMAKMNIDALAFTGHKGLLGPQGIGGFILTDEMVSKVEPLISGGSGSISHTEEVPSFMPDRFEAGTPNIPGIIGLHESLLWLKRTGLDTVLKKERSLTKLFLEGIEPLEEEGLIRIIGPRTLLDRCAVVSIQLTKMDQSEAAYRLDEEYGIMTRVGLHCAPAAHKSLGTYPEGTIRFSFGYSNEPSDILRAVKALEEICHGI